MKQPELPPPAWQVVRRIARRYRPDKIIVFGSHARGDTHVGSDLDLIIVKDTADPILSRLDQVLSLCTGEIAVEPLVYTPAELSEMLARGNDFLETALAEGVTVYDKQQPRRSRAMASAGTTRS